MTPPARLHWCFIAAILLAGTASYASSFRGQFVHDDRPHILANEALHDLGDMKSVLSWSRRPLVNLSLALNIHFGKDGVTGKISPFGFHAFNLAIHLLAGLTLYGVVRRSICLSPPDTWVNNAHWVAFAAALLWVVHPLNTQAVTYIIQRAESMMGLFYLLTLYCFIRSNDSPRVFLWRTLAITAAGLGMFSKAVIITVPLTIFLYDRCFIAGSFKVALQKRWAFYLPLCATGLLLLSTGVAQGVLNPNHYGPATVGFAYTDVSPFNYLLNQGSIILHYLRLSVWPDTLCFDYKWPVVKTWGALLPGLIVISLLGLTTLWLLWKRPRLGFIGAWFFIILGPTSSFIPIEDMAAEHRMYLSLAAITTIASLVFLYIANQLPQQYLLTGRRVTFAGLALICTTASGFATFQRNLVYHDPLTLWRDVIAKRPDNPRGHLYLGTYLGKQGDLRAATEHYLTALQKDSLYAEARFNYGSVLGMRGQYESAISQFRQLISDHPDYVEGYVGLATALLQIKSYDNAIDALQHALENKPGHERAAQLLDYARQQKQASLPPE